MAKCSNFGWYIFHIKSIPIFFEREPNKEVRIWGLNLEPTVLHSANEGRDQGTYSFLWSCSYAWTLPTAWRWYITLIRFRVTQLKHGRATSELGFLIVSLCFAWILGLLYQGKKKKKTSKWMEKKTKRYSKFLICLHDWPQKWWTCFPLVFSIT